jgi:hypothetical protein
MARLRRMLLTLAVAALLLVGTASTALAANHRHRSRLSRSRRSKPARRTGPPPSGGALRWLMLQLWVPLPGATFFCGDP